jgi:hypothetical protein
MSRTDDLAYLDGIIASEKFRTGVGRVDLTPNGPLTVVGPGPWCFNPWDNTSVFVKQVAGSTGAVVAIEVNHEGDSIVDEIGRTDSKLAGAGTGWSGVNDSRAPLVRLNVISIPADGQITGTLVGRRAL